MEKGWSWGVDVTEWERARYRKSSIRKNHIGTTGSGVRVGSGERRRRSGGCSYERKAEKRRTGVAEEEGDKMLHKNEQT